MQNSFTVPIRSNRNVSNGKIEVAVANATDRAAIYRLRHEIYALELNQHSPNAAESLQDALDDTNTYIVAKQRGEIAGFVSVTPPEANQFSIDKYFDRAELP